MTSPNDKRKRIRPRIVAWLLVALCCIASGPYFARRWRSAVLLARVADASFDASSIVRATRLDITTPRGLLPAWVYSPIGRGDVPGVVLLHGVSAKGMNDPRFVRFASALAASGLSVMTPQLQGLADYQIEASSIDVAAAAVTEFAAVHRSRVGLIGISFGGGVALLSASRADVSPHTAFVVAIGAHEDLARVTNYFVTGSIVGPDGRPGSVKPHDYGAMVLAYSHALDLFPSAEAQTAQRALGLWLREEQTQARETAAQLSPPSRERVEALFAGKYIDVREALLDVIAKRRDEMALVSPARHLSTLRAPVYLLHGTGDSVIPATETAWLAREVPSVWMRKALVSDAIVHVDMQKSPSNLDRLDLVDFMGRVLGEADDL